MKKFDMRKIMTRAWEIVKTAMVSISEGLVKAWREAKNTKTKIVNEVKLALNPEYDDDCASKWITFKVWKKYGKARVYANSYKGVAFGYIENGEWVSCQKYDTNPVMAVVEQFMANYEI